MAFYMPTSRAQQRMRQWWSTDALGIAAASVGTDPYFANVVSLLHFDGTNGSSTFTDQTGKTWGATVAVLSTAEFKFGTASGFFNGSLIDCSDAALAIGTADFTQEFWAYRTASGTSIMVDQRPALTNGLYPAIYHDSSGNLHYFVNNADQITGSGGNMPLNTWVHVAICRASGSTRMFADGVQVGSTYSDSNNYLFGRQRIGANSYDATTGTNFTGYIDEFRLTIGVGRYTANFTPPASAFPNS